MGVGGCGWDETCPQLCQSTHNACTHKHAVGLCTWSDAVGVKAVLLRQLLSCYQGLPDHLLGLFRRPFTSAMGRAMDGIVVGVMGGVVGGVMGGVVGGVMGGVVGGQQAEQRQP